MTMYSTSKPDEKKQVDQTLVANRLGIRGRLLIGFSVITFIFLVAIFYNIIITASTQDFSKKVIQHDLPLYSYLLDLGVQINLANSSVYRMSFSTNSTLKNDYVAAWANIHKLTTEIDDLSANFVNEKLKSDWLKVKSLLSQLEENQTKAMNYLSSNVVQNKEQVLNSLSAITVELLDILDGKMQVNNQREDGMFDVQYDVLHNGAEKILFDMNSALIVESVLTVIAIISAIFIAFFTARSILKHINFFREYSSKIATGDLRQSLAIGGNDEMSKLGKDLNIMTDSLATVAKQITDACQNMVSSLEEVKQAVDVQSSGATQQASSINEITASLSQIEKSANQTMDKAKTLGDAAERTREKGQQGLEAVEQSILGMKAVRDKVQTIAQTILDLSMQTQQVGEITAVVNNLAQQSKMLALNASIEAAKAGEAGKGFAVVATEVKSLAEQSEQSTSQVQKILEDIRLATEKAVMVTEEGTKGVDQGTTLVEQTGEIVRSLSDVISETTLASQQIEAAVKQESVGIEQITAGMNEINQVTTSFVASANQTLEAINHLSAIAKNLKEHVDVYKV